MPAGDAVIGALRVVLGTDTAQFEDGLKSANSALGSFAKSVAATAAGVQLSQFIDNITSSFSNLVKSGIETADQIGKMSQRIGVDVDSLSELRVAATLSDVSMQELGQSMARLERNMVSAASGGVGPAASAFMYLGISAKQLRSLSPEDVLEKMADAFSKMENGANKTAVAVAVFGRAGAQMIPLLNLGSKGFDEMRDMAEKLGLTISEKTAKAAERFVDSGKLMALAFQGIGNTVAAYFLPNMAKSSEAMVKWVANSGLVASASEVIIRSFLFIKDNALLLAAAFAIIFGPQMILAVVALATAVFNLGRAMALASLAAWANPIALIVGLVAALAAGIVYLVTQVKAVKEAMDEWGVTGFLANAGAWVSYLFKLAVNTTSLSQALPGLKQNAEDASKALNDLLNKDFKANASERAKAMTMELAKLSLQARESFGQFNTLADGFVRAAISAKLFENEQEALSLNANKLTKEQKAFNEAVATAEKGKIFKETLPAIQQYEQELAHLNALYPESARNLQEYQAKTTESWNKLVQTIGGAVDQSIQGFANLAQALGGKSKAAFEAWKALAIAEATVSAYLAASKALAMTTLPWPLPLIAAAAAYASGIANIIKITQTQFTPAAMGGDFMVPGGKLGVDTKMISMALAPGELVKVTPSSQAGGGKAQEIQLNPIKPGDLFTGSMVRGLFDALNKGYADGYKVKFA